MRLTPYADVGLRTVKVLKHVFGRAERWWEVLDGRPAWEDDRDTLARAGCFSVLSEEAHLVAVSSGTAGEVLTRRHQDWLDAAGRAAEEARAAGGDRVIVQPDGRQQLIGDGGVVVVVAAQSQLVTCWREPDGTSAAVRRRQRRASLNQPPPTRR